MLISMIVAMAENRVIGQDNKLLWHLPADLQHFKQTTMGKPILMGRKTYESIGRPLPGRQNIVMTHDASFVAEGVTVVHSTAAALRAVKNSSEVVVIGGGKLYQAFLPQTQRLYMTVVHQQFMGDTFFPELLESEWQEVECKKYPADEKHPYAFSFVLLERKIS